ncbi:MAG: hypothetical protein IJ228_12615 [Succinivibrio sp.]|nr:hypothetical protein [Succinivibrio sp.]
MFTYRVGWPFWKQIHRLTNCRLSYRYDILKDAETGEYLGTSPDIKGLYAECRTPEEVREVMEYGAADFA